MNDAGEIKSSLRSLLRDKGVLITLDLLAESIEEVAGEPEFGGGAARRVWQEMADVIRKVRGQSPT